MTKTTLILATCLLALGHASVYAEPANGSKAAAAATAPITSGRWLAFSQKPAGSWQDAFPTGNGDHGTMPCGAPGQERVINVHGQLFLRSYDRTLMAVPDIAKLMPEVRRLCEAGQTRAAAVLACNEARKQLTAMGAPQVNPVCPHPAFDIQFGLAPTGSVQDYRRSLDMETGETVTTWKDDTGGVEESVFSSRTADANIVRLKANSGRKLDLSLALVETPGRKGKYGDVDLENGIREVKNDAEQGWLTYHAKYGHDKGGYEGLARVTAKGGAQTVENGRMVIKGADEVLIVIRITPLADGDATEQNAVKKELTALPTDYDAILIPSAKQHGEMFRRAALDMGQAEAWKTTPVETMLAQVHTQGPSPLFYEQMHAMGRHLLISTCGHNPPPLQGIWGGSWNPRWFGGFVLDTNLNLAISNVSMGGLPECADSYAGYVERMLPGWRRNAKGYLGCRGFLVPHYSDPANGNLDHFLADYPWMYWPAGAGWNLMPLYEDAMIRGDMEMLRKRVLPLYREMADFYEDYLTKGKDGAWHVVPSISPENFTRGSLLTRDATMDVAVAREVFGHLVTMGKLFKLDEKDIARWQSYHDGMTPYRINAHGALAEWCDPFFPDFYKHRHNSHLYPVFPGTEFLQPGSDPKWIKATQVALDKRFASDTESAHGLVHVALMAARLHDPKKIAANLNRFSRRNYVYGGLVTSHNPNHDVYNLDSVLSLPRLFAEMAVFSQPGRIELLPAMPETHPAGTMSGIHIHGGHSLDVAWKDGKLVSATLHAGKDGKLVVVANGATRTITVEAGKSYPIGK